MTDTVIATVAGIITAAFFTGALVNAHWEKKVHKAPLVCRMQLLADEPNFDQPDQPTSPGSGR